jgi:hypothetical protein
MPEAEKLKRPAAHRWVIGLLCFMMAASVIFLTDSSTGRGGANSTRYWIVLAVLCGCLFTLFCLIVGGRHRWAYYVTSGFLGILAIRGVYSLIQFLWLFAIGKSPGHTLFPQNAAFSQLTASVRPFFVQQVMFFSYQLIMPGIVGLFVWTFMRFTFTHESRSYFQFKKCARNDPGEPGKSTKQHEDAPTLT